MMVYTAMWILAAQLSALLWLGHTEEIPDADKFDMFQREVIPSFPVDKRLLQQPLLIQGESVLSPRGRRPVSSSRNDLKDFPPGRPSSSNIDSICGRNRVKVSYGPHNVPRSGYAHLSRQGDAINEIEEGFARCCLQSDKLRCAEEVWKTSMENFCNAEFTVKTRHFHCCKKDGSEREACFSNEAPNPDYDTPISMQQEARDVPNLRDLGVLEDTELCPPNSPTCQDMSPRGRRPVSSSRNNLKDFPPGRPSSSNIGSICGRNRVKVSYGPHNVPRSGYGHLSRQGDAINEIEEGFARCCLQSDQLRCAEEVWKTSMENFCNAEFIVKTRHFHCCKKDGSERETCFSNEAPNPDYDTPISMVQKARDVPNLRDLGVLGDTEPCPPNSPTCQDMKMPDQAFPPGKPKSSNIQNICKLGKYRLHADKALSQSGFKYPPRQIKAINHLEKEYKKCCKKNDEACAQSAWEKVLAKFCAEEKSVKTVPHPCCGNDDQVMYRCFAAEAPFPEYDREVEALDLSAMTEAMLEKLCGEFKLLTKKRQLPLLVTNLKDLCCSLPQDRKMGCAAEQKKKHIKTLCGPRKDSWKDTQNCCSKDEQERDQCFGSYLQNVSVAVMGGDKAE